MGVPSFYRWLVARIPNFVMDAYDNIPNQDSINPEIDNFYIDMNGVIHNCLHPSEGLNLKTPKSTEDILNNIFIYIDRLVNIVRPKKLLYMALDGVAPKAKMN
jgi:5'-3' exoribonuclease 2